MRFAPAALLGALALLAGCRDQPAPANEFDPATIAAAGACREQIFEGTRFTICPFDTNRDRIELAWRGADGRPLRSLPALRDWLGPRAADVRFAMNAGMYDDKGAPIGLLVVDGARLKPLNLNTGPGNFHLLPNGVFAVDEAGRVSVTASRDFAARVPKPRWATQSGPMLVIDGALHPGLADNGDSRYVRNGVGVRDARRGVFAISDEPVSFGRFARLFRDALGCRDALYLDGSVSSIWDPGAGREQGHMELGPLIVVSRGK
ncbi:hypothetical protein E2493_13800 [Sphingomonas parva]|uniref:Phosphodiester glycosidase domain-containing protein n=1 Tax=Sphingomonas parva TaxID=2555898 RepID=A0A4Y8ZTD2_9SPHN|nr:phosphodiester glycosidase family protein [Sphingomonas parva]TFI57716.1 hypothetical protein E2493_13800 [Sphingomonas parva]